MTNPRHIVSLFNFLRTAPGANDYDVHRFSSSTGTLYVRTDWSGESQSHGTFAILSSDERWLECGNLSPDTGINDLILPASKLSATSLKLYVERGPFYPSVPFEVWATPIEWRLGRAPGKEPAPEYVATYDVDYVRRPEAGEQRQSSSLNGAVQSVTLHLPTTMDYELWVKLLHPTRDGLFSIIDPIVRSDDHGGTPTIAVS